MNHTISTYSINLNQSNSFQSRSPGTSHRVEGLIGMNDYRDRSSPDNDDGANKNDKTMVPLHDDFMPGDDDVICGRGKKCYAHTGNERFRRIVQSKLEKYSAASSRPEKSEILSSIVSEVRLNSPDGGFVKQDTGTGKWFEVGDFLAREKTSQAFRDALHEDYRSSKKSKHEKRRQRTKAKAMTEKRSQSSSPGSSSGGAHQHEGGMPNDQLLYPPLNSSPLVSRQQLTVLREEPSHPRAYSFSGQAREQRARTAPRASRAMSLSLVHGGGRVTDDRSDLLYGEQRYHRADSAPSYHDHDRSISGEEIAAFHHQERLDSRHESWPQPYATNHAAMFSPPASFHASAPQFHPVGADDVAAHRPYPGDDVAAHRSYPDSDAIMREVDNVRVGGVSSHTHMPSPHWPIAEREGDMPPLGAVSRGPLTSHTRAYASAPTPMEAYSGNPGVSSARVHHRNDSTASATVNVAQLASAIPSESLQVDDNPFEPIPIGGRSKKKARTEGSPQGKWREG